MKDLSVLELRGILGVMEREDYEGVIVIDSVTGGVETSESRVDKSGA